MAATQSSASIWSSTTLSAGTPITCTAVTVGSYYAAVLNFSIVNGSTAPTLPAKIQIQVSNNGTTFYDFGGAFVGTSGTAGNSVTSPWGGIALPFGIAKVQLVASGNTDQSVTINADIGYISAV